MLLLCFHCSVCFCVVLLLCIYALLLGVVEAGVMGCDRICRRRGLW